MTISEITVKIIKRQWVIRPVFLLLKFMVWAGVKNERVIGGGIDFISKHGFRMKF